jgi:hypothetical protein
MGVSVKLDVQSMLRANQEHQRTVKKAAARAINRTIDGARTNGAREVAAATKLKVRDVRSRMTITGASPDRLIAELTAHPYSPNLKAFRATQNRKGVAASAWEGRKTYRHAFILKGSGKVVTRTGSGRSPLKGLRGPSVPRTFVKPAIIEKIDKAARVRFSAEFDREIARRIRG